MLRTLAKRRRDAGRRACPLAPDRATDVDLRCRAAPLARRTRATRCTSTTTTRGAARARRPRCPRPASARSGPAAPPGCSTPRARTAAGDRACTSSASPRPTQRAERRGRHRRLHRAASTVETDGATPLLEPGEQAGALMPSGCRMGICHTCVSPARGPRARHAHRRGPRRARRPRPDLRLHRERPRWIDTRPRSSHDLACTDPRVPPRRWRRRPRARPARPADRRATPSPAPLTAEQVEELGRRARRDPRTRSSPRAARRTPTTSARSSRRSAASRSAAAALLFAGSCRPPGSPAPRCSRPPRSSRTWRSATTSCTASGTGCVTPRSTPRRGSGTTSAPAASGSTPTTCCTTPTPTSSARTATSATGSCASSGEQQWRPYYLLQPVLQRAARAAVPVGRRAARPRDREGLRGQQAVEGRLADAQGAWAARSASRSPRTTWCSRCSPARSSCRCCRQR